MGSADRTALAPPSCKGKALFLLGGLVDDRGLLPAAAVGLALARARGAGGATRTVAERGEAFARACCCNVMMCAIYYSTLWESNLLWGVFVFLFYKCVASRLSLSRRYHY